MGKKYILIFNFVGLIYAQSFNIARIQYGGGVTGTATRAACLIFCNT